MHFTDPLTQTVLVFLLATAISAISIPTIGKVARTKQLVDIPNGRTSHTGMIPSLGGFAIFIAVFLSILLFVNFQMNPGIQYLLVGLLIIFFIGLKDDILVLDPRKKLLAQIVAASLVIFLGDVHFTSLHGFLGVHQIPPVAGYLLTLFVVIVITNSFNLIDGIDGLASGVGILISLLLGIYFYHIGQHQLAIIALAFTGACIGFFYFNISKGNNKIFMGDTGSLTLGFTLAFLIIHFNELNLLPQKMNIASAPAVSFGIFIVPLFDTARIFLLRTLRGKSPFNPDKQHVHHRLLYMNDSHLKTTGIIIGFNLVFIAMVVLLQHLHIIELMAIELAVAGFFSNLPVMMIRSKARIENIPYSAIEDIEAAMSQSYSWKEEAKQKQYHEIHA
ncbi:MAG: undecaprenyl/decaprenyl-phosphate alpha-N-acetylglucosaminyl 1-phosphate transferase [Bacteroidales bacterium]|nr:undecaprenyl/decaprenyl-phosphate alpha-N-acetylglucosaminyl 1-phosphate transferase [Bacteroidales bacterium]